MAFPAKINKKEAVRLYQSGLGVQSIAKHFGCTHGPVWRALKGLVEMRPAQGRKFEPSEAAMLYAKGLSTPAIATKLGVSPHAVQEALRNAGVKLRSIGAARNLIAKDRRINAYGYAMLRVGPRKYVLEHRVIAERVLGRSLKRTEYVHHINCDRADNSNRNLLICSHDYHASIHARMRAHPYWAKFSKGE